MNKSNYSNKAIIVTLGRSIEKILLIILYVLLSRYLSKYDYGTYRQVILVYSFFMIIFVFGMPASINYFLPKLNFEKQKTLIIQTVLFLLIISFLLGGTLLLFNDTLSKILNNVNLKSLTILLSLLLIFSLPASIYYNFLIMIDKTKLCGLLSIIFGFMKLGFVLIAILYYNSIFNILLSLVLFSFLQLVIVLIIIFRYYSGISFTFSRVQFIKQFQFAFPLGIASIIGILIKRMDQFMISYFFNPTDYAEYANGSIEIPFLSILTNSVMVVLMPFFVLAFEEGRISDFVSKWQTAILKVGLLIIPICAFLISYSNEIIVSLFSQKYVISGLIFKIYLFSEFARITIFGNILLALGKSKTIFKFASITLLLNLILNLIMIKIFGLIGPAIASVLSVYIMNTMQLFEISRTLNVKVHNLWPWKKLTIILFISFLIALLSSVPKYLFDTLILQISIGVIIFLISYYLLFKKTISKMYPNLDFIFWKR
ncbi:MAG: oligosaccharide flippase family protein [Candidatus Cloacimonetes bacterium]|nr:oligosaccharide flippase family protein [Candidatus Cloacimonadota bacterium]